MLEARSLVTRLSAPIAIFALAVLYMLLDAALFRTVDFGCDWAPLWAAGRMALSDPSRIYDFHAVTLMQQPLFDATVLRPFVYPPTTLLLLVPLSVFPFFWSFALFALASVAVFERVSTRLSAQPAIVLLMPPVVLAALVGQPTLVVAALILAALMLLPRDERTAGLLIGIAAAIKPPLLILAPLGLCAGRHWRALWVSALVGSVMGLASVALFGIEPWKQWFAALPEFQTLVAGFEPLARKTVTPFAMATRFGISGPAVLAVTVPAALLLVFFAFRRSSDTAVRLTALVGGALLISPYAMDYELAAFAPAVAAIRLRGVKDAALPAIWTASLFASASIVGLLTMCAWAAVRLVRAGAQPETMERCRSGSMLPPESTATVALPG